ncbi:hypothetical protein AOLI_G00234220 [Acnodon oligacanthus]
MKILLVFTLFLISAAQFWVLIRELTVEDSGTYRCGVDRKEQLDVYTAVELKVEEDQQYMKSISVTGHVGGGVNISCKYPQSHSSDPKFLCRRAGSADCSYETSVKERRRWRNEGKLQLHDDGKQIFTVTINSLTEGDSGEYWCGAESDWTSDHGYKVYITQINLTVTEFPASSVITVVCVILVVFLIGLIFMIVAVRKRLRPQDPASTPTRPLRGSSNSYMDSVAVYSNIEEAGHLPDSDAGVSTVCSSVSSPANPSDPSQHIYNNDQLPMGPCEFSDPVYSNIQLLSSSFDKDVDSTCPGVP